jgi:hypothetical protein
MRTHGVFFSAALLSLTALAALCVPGCTGALPVGNEYWATSTSAEWAPHFPLFKSSDLLHAVRGVEGGRQREYLPPWDRAVRVALTVGGVTGASARFDSMYINPE